MSFCKKNWSIEQTPTWISSISVSVAKNRGVSYIHIDIVLINVYKPINNVNMKT